MAVQILLGHNADDPEQLLARTYDNATTWSIDNGVLWIKSVSKIYAAFPKRQWMGVEIVD